MKVSGTRVLLFSDGELIAYQRGLTIDASVNLPDATDKESGGWEEHIHGMRNATVSFDALYSTEGLSADALIELIRSRPDLMMCINGLSATNHRPIIGLVNLDSVSLNAPIEEAMAVSGSMKVNGELFRISAAPAINNLRVYTNYNTFVTDLTVTGLTADVASPSGVKRADSNFLSVTTEGEVMFLCSLKLNSGQLPTVEIAEYQEGDAISNVVTLQPGGNAVRLKATSTQAAAVITIRNTAATNFELRSVWGLKK